MPRKPSFTSQELTEKALNQFWFHGYNASSMDDLVAATGVSRHGIYSNSGGKKQLFLACFERYQQNVVSPAFAQVEAPDADLASIYGYFDDQISAGDAAGLPGPGCFVANSATEVAPNDTDTMAEVRRHNHRLRSGFQHALTNHFLPDPAVTPAEISELAETLLIFTNGLWSTSRVVSEADILRRSVQKFLKLIAEYGA